MSLEEFTHVRCPKAGDNEPRLGVQRSGRVSINIQCDEPALGKAHACGAACLTKAHLSSEFAPHLRTSGIATRSRR